MIIGGTPGGRVPRAREGYIFIRHKPIQILYGVLVPSKVRLLDGGNTTSKNQS